jgi:aminoglycoside phosphotransferase (APT) family kinase protein
LPATSETDAKLRRWISDHFGGEVVRCERQVRWRPGWYVDVKRGDELLSLYIRGDRKEEFPPWPLEHEAAVLRILREGGVPVPKVHGLCDEPFAIVLDRVPGRHNLATATDEAERLSVQKHLAEIMAQMHGLDVKPFVANGLKHPQTPPEIALPYFLEGDRLYLKYKSAPDPRMEFVRRWVYRNLPPNRTEVSFLHGDPAQFLFQDGRITAMLDFEWGCLGDRMMDLAGLRMRAIYEPMGDIRPLLRRYCEVTGVKLEHDVLGFHTVAWIINTSLAIAPSVASPKPGVDYPEYVSWYVVSLIFALKALAEVRGLPLPDMPPRPAPKPSRWAQSIELLGDHFPETVADGSTEHHRQHLGRASVAFARSLDGYHELLEREYLSDVARLLGRPVADWREADRLLEAFVLEAGPEHDAELMSIFYRWAWTQTGLFDSLVNNPMLRLPLQPLSELVSV